MRPINQAVAISLILRITKNIIEHFLRLGHAHGITAAIFLDHFFADSSISSRPEFQELRIAASCIHISKEEERGWHIGHAQTYFIQILGGKR